MARVRFGLHLKHVFVWETLTVMSSNSSLRSPDSLVVVTVISLVILIAISGMVAPPPSRTSPASYSVEEFVEQNTKFYSQFDEELLIRYFFNDERNGVYLDVGCSFPKKNSTTYYLETTLGWTGIGIDAVESYGRFWAQLRPRSKFIHTAVSDKTGDIVTFYQAEHPGLSSFDKDWGGQFGMKDPVPVEVETITLNDLLERENVDHIDLLSMDIEGAEPLALTGFDIEKYAPRLVCIEVNDRSESEPFIRDYFKKHGYTLINEFEALDSVNRYYEPKKPR